MMYQRRYKRRRAASRAPRRYYGRRYVRGQGGYLSGVPRAILNTAGGYLGGVGGSMLPIPGAGIVGGMLGGNAANKIADVMGLGAYTVKANTLVMDEGAQIPAFGDMSQAVILKHREYIGDVTVPASPGAFTLDSFRLNPGDSKTFPWLSNVARSFDQFMLLGIIFEFRSTSSDSVGANIGQGVVIMATDYDATDPAFSSKIEMENSQYCTSTKPSDSCSHIIECDPSVTAQSHLFVRHLGTPISGDLRFYDHGIFQIATQGLPAGTTGTIGELWCSYQVAFFKPQLHNEDSLMVKWRATTNIAVSTPLGTASGVINPPVSGSTLITFVIDGNTLYFYGAAVGDKYVVLYRAVGSSATLTNTFALTGTGVTVDLQQSHAAGAASSEAWFNAYITITSTNVPRLQFTSATFPTSPTLSFLNVIKTEDVITMP